MQTRNGTLVNKEKWNYIQKAFPEEVKARLTGAETPKKTGKLENRYLLGHTEANHVGM